MKEQKYWVVGNTHVDLAWKKSREEMAEVLDIYLARVLDILDSNPDFTYTIEQAAHYRLLMKRRPDLFAKIKKYVREGRLEMVGGMASTMETNLPNGECFIRNQALGLEWTKQYLETDVATAWLIDTFGLHAQVPQLLRQFGFSRLMANRFGGNKSHDVFIARGLDGSEVLVAGKDVTSPNVKQRNVHWRYVRNWGELDQLFLRAEAAAAQVDGPILITAYTENEDLPSARPGYHIERGNAGGNDGLWRYSLLRSFFDALEAQGRSWPVLHGDLNPEFTGTFSQRIEIRLRHRKVENLLLDAEKWASLVGMDGWREELEEAWWEMAYIQFHDVFTGSHPTKVFHSLLNSLDEVQAVAQRVLGRALHAQSGSIEQAQGKSTILVCNSLPWPRDELVLLPLEGGVSDVPRVRSGENGVLFDVKDGYLRVLTHVPAMGVTSLTIDPDPGRCGEAAAHIVDEARIENEYLILECDRGSLVKRLIWKETGKSIIENASDWLIVQRDQGSFQIEEPRDAEIPASMGKVEVVQYEATAIGQRIVLRGTFPGIPDVGAAGFLSWEAKLELCKGKPALDVGFRLGWSGEASRLRFNLTSTIDSSEGIYEIPFGTVKRKPSGMRRTGRGEWPAHRFVVIEDGEHGLALINQGAAGVEVVGGRISTTLLRAPKSEYAGMVPDDTSSQHGEHAFEFVIAPYSGKWEDSAVMRLAQEANSPLRPVVCPAELRELPSVHSWLALSPSRVVLSAVKASDRVAGELIVRMYETAGQPATARLWVKGAKRAWRTSVREELEGPELSCTDEIVDVQIQPFEICTLRVCRAE
ncbi:MAG: alpha-mannosidase [Paenibacillaceae bacterium]|nr:alpha-mannosidase [Paenibacillaceae bacterium]